MAYSGYLLKIGNYTVSAKRFISAESYSVTRNVQDLDSYRDADGYLHRNALSHAPTKVEFKTPPMLTNTDMAEFMAAIRGQYISGKEAERKVLITAYVPELDDYTTEEMYMSDPQFDIYGSYGNKLTYKTVRFAFIGY